VLTGAGISAESGVPTFRGIDGLWENHPVEEVASPQGFAKDPALVWRFYSQRRANVLEVTPNAGHTALARLEAALGERFLLATQNVDGLHARAGSKRLVELHGNLFRTRCSVCALAPFEDKRVYLTTALPECAACASKGRESLLRPDIVWFGEMLAESDVARVTEFIAVAGEHLIFVAVGTSGAVYPAAGFVDLARAAGASTWLVNMDSADNAHRFEHFVQGASGKVLPGLFEVVQ
jgi:NAD-dependent deacetylase